MPINVRMPDGTVLTNVPDDITQSEVLSRYNAYLAQQDRDPIVVEPEEETSVLDRAPAAAARRAPVERQDGLGYLLGNPATLPARQDPGALADIGNYMGSSIGAQAAGLGRGLEDAPRIARAQLADPMGMFSAFGGTAGTILPALARAGIEYAYDAIAPNADEEYRAAVAPVSNPLIEAGERTQQLYTPYTGTPSREYSAAREEGEGVPYALWRGARAALIGGAGSAPTIAAGLVAGRLAGPRAAAGVMGAGSTAAAYEGIRQTQEREGIADPNRAFSAALASGLLDATTGLGGRTIATATQAALRKGVERGLSGVMREVGRTGLSEAGTEVVQNLIEQVGGGQNPLTEESLLQSLDAGLTGFAGGVVLGTPVEGLNRRNDANMRRAFGEQPKLQTIEVNVPGDGGRSVPTILDILSAPDANGNVRVRTADGTPYVDSLANIEAMRPAPTQGETRENLTDVLTEAAMQNADDAALSAAVNVLMNDPADGSARALLRARLRNHGIPDHIADQIVDQTLANAAVNAQAAGPEAAATAATNSINRAAKGKNKAVKAGQEQAIVEAKEEVAAAPAQPKRRAKKTQKATTTAPLSDQRFSPLANNEATTRFPKTEAPRNAFFNGAMGTSPIDFFTGRKTKMTKAEVTAFNEGRAWGAEQGRTVSETELTLKRPIAPKAAPEANAIWAGPEYDNPVFVVGKPPQVGPDGRNYVEVTLNGVPSFAPVEELRPLEGETSALEAGLGRLTQPPQADQDVGAELGGAEPGVPSAVGKQRGKRAAATTTGAGPAGVDTTGGAAGVPVGGEQPSQPPVTKVAPGDARGTRETRTGMMGTQRGRPVQGAAELTAGMQAQQKLYAELETARAMNEISDQDFAEVVSFLETPGTKEDFAALPEEAQIAWNIGISAQRAVDQREAYIAELADKIEEAAKKKKPIKALKKELDEAKEGLAALQKPLDATQEVVVDAARTELNRRRSERAGAQVTIRERLKDPTLTELERRDLQIQLRQNKVDRKYRRKGEGAGLDVGAVKAHIAKIVSGWRAAVDVQVVGSLDELPADVREAVIADGAQGAQGLVAPDGTIYIFAENLDTLEDATATVYHEALGHMGLSALFGKRLDSVLQDILDSNKALREEAEQWVRDNPGAYQGDNALIRALEEVLVERSENGRLQASIWSKIVGVFKDFGRRIGMKLAYTDGEVRTLLAMAHDMIVDGPQTSTVMNGLRYVNTWHGSRADFSEFSTDFINTGERNQAYGWGLYFTDTKQIAERNYRDRLAGYEYTANGKSLEEWADENLKSLGVPYTQAIRSIEMYLPQYASVREMLDSTRLSLEQEGQRLAELESEAARDMGPEDEDYAGYTRSIKNTIARWSREVAVLEKLADAKVEKKSAGKLYNVELAPKDDEWMLWDAPLSEQSDKVKAALEKLGIDLAASKQLEALREEMRPVNRQYIQAMSRATQARNRDRVAEQEALDEAKELSKILTPMIRRIEELEKTTAATGREAYLMLESRSRSPKAASLALLDAGVRGNKYLDGFSRGPNKEDRTFNYVLFDDADAEIVNKYSRKKATPTPAAAKKTKAKTPAEEAAEAEAKAQAKTRRGVDKVERSLEAGGLRNPDAVGAGLNEASEGASEFFRSLVDQAAEPFIDLLDFAQKNLLVSSALRTSLRRGSPDTATIAEQIQEVLARMQAMQRSMAKAMGGIGKGLQTFLRSNKDANYRLAKTMHLARVLRHNPTLYKDRASALAEDRLIVSQRAESAKLKSKKDADAKAKIEATIKQRETDINATWDAYEALGKLEGGHFQFRKQLQFFKDMHTALLAALDSNLEMLNIPPETKEQLKKLRDPDPDEVTDADDDYPGVKASLLDEVYFPFSRFGDFVMVAKWKGKNGRRARWHYDTRADRAKFERRFKRDYAKDIADGRVTYEFMNAADAQALDMQESTLLRDIFNAIEKTAPKGSTEEEYAAFKKQAKDRIYQVYLLSLPERSLRKQFVHAKLIEGQSSDVGRVFADAASRYASQLPKFIARPKIDRLVSEGKKSLEGLQGTDPSKKEDLLSTFTILANRAEEEFTNQEISGVAKFINLTAFGHLMTGALSTFVQTVAFPQQAMPRMLIQYPTVAPTIISAYLKVLGELPRLVIEVDPATGERTVGMPSFGNTKFIQNNKARQKLFRELESRGFFFQHQTDMVLRNMSGPQPGITGAAGNLYEDTIRAMGIPMTSMDQLVREMTAMMFAEMEYKKTKNFDAAIAAAIRNTDDTLGDYSDYEQPGVFRGGIGRFLRFLRTYSVQRAKYFGRMILDVRRGSPYQNRLQTITELLTVGFITTLFGGVTSNFGYSLLTTLAEALFSAMMDDDEEEEFRRENPSSFGPSIRSNITGTEFNADHYLRYKIIPELFGVDSDVTRSLQKGLISNLLNIDLSGRVSQNDLFVRDWRSGDDTVQTLFNFIEANLAPQISSGAGFVRGFEALVKGDWQRAIKGLTPAAFRGSLLAGEYAEEGIMPKTASPEPVFTPEEVSRGVAPPRPGTNDPLRGVTREEARGLVDGLTAVALGGQPLDVALVYERDINPLFEVRNAYENRKTALLERVRREFFRPNPDPEQFAKLREDIDAYNRTVPVDLRMSHVIDAPRIADSIEASLRQPRFRGYTVEKDEAILMLRDRGLVSDDEADALTLLLAQERAARQ